MGHAAELHPVRIEQVLLDQSFHAILGVATDGHDNHRVEQIQRRLQELVADLLNASFSRAL